MENISSTIKQFFDTYQQANASFDIEIIGSLYGESFLFGQPQGVQTIKKEDFLKVLPKRKGFFQMIGQKSATITQLEETILDEHYIQVQSTWKMVYEKEQKSIEDINKATYILYKKDNTLQIVVQIDHQDLMQKVQALGLLPAKV